MSRIAVLLYGIISYALAFASLVYAIGFVENMVVPKTIDVGPTSPLLTALIINSVVLGLFAVQHSTMARSGFKKLITTYLPRSIERSTYVLVSALLMWLIFWQWRPITDVVWQVDNAVIASVLIAISFVGWIILFGSSFLISHWELFGLQQVYDNWKGRAERAYQFRTPFLYKIVRHPIYFGMLLAFWVTPIMTVGHLLFAVLTTGYILIGTYFEERDLITAFGDQYRQYKKSVPMLIPWRMRS
ncbi:MAG: methanethiol S-methyltransferase [Hyphomicrobiaceae bacterium]